MKQENRSFWDRLLGSRSSKREQKVLEYIVHRMNEGANLRDVVEEEYVRRNLSRSQIDDTLSNPRIVEAARETMQDAFHSGGLAFERRRIDRKV